MLMLSDDAAAWGEVGYSPGRSVRIDHATRCEPNQLTCSLYLAIHQRGEFPQSRVRCDLLDRGRRSRIFDAAVRDTIGGVNFQTAEFSQRPLGPKELRQEPSIRCWSSQEIRQEVSLLPARTYSFVPEQWRFREGAVEAVTIRSVVRLWQKKSDHHFSAGATAYVRCGFYRSAGLVRVAETAVVDENGTGESVGTITLNPPIRQVTGIECAKRPPENGVWFDL